MGPKNARTPTRALTTHGDIVRPQQRRNPRIERLVWKMLLPTRELAGSGGRRFLQHTNNPSSPAPRTVREWARSPHDALPPSPCMRALSRRAGGKQPREKRWSGVATAWN